MRLSLFLLLLSLSMNSFSQSPLIRTPELSPDGSSIAFSYQGDIWTVPSTGGDAVRLTVHEAYEGNPKFSRDGKHIAFASDRFGSDDIYIMSTKGAELKRLTFHSAGDDLYSWTKDGNLLFTTERVWNQVEWDPEMWSISAKGGTEERLLDAFGYMPVQSPNGRYIAFARGACRIAREDYRGPSNKDLWLYDSKNKSYTQLTDFDGNDIFPQWGSDSEIYFVSARSGRYNVYKMNLGAEGVPSGDPQPLTSYKDDGVRTLSVSADGSKLAFERQTDIYLMNSSGGKAEKVEVNVTGDYRFDPYEYSTQTSGLSDYAVSPNGKYVAFSVRGEIFVMPSDKDKKRAVNISDHSWRDEDPAWLNDSTLIFSSDRDGSYDLYVAQSSDSDQTDLYKTLKRAVRKITREKDDVTSPTISHKGDRIAYRMGRGKMLVAEIDASGNIRKEKTLLDGWATPGGLSWSPDDQWLAYSLDDLNFNEEIYIRDSEGKNDPVNISLHPKGDYSPVWSRDGSKLAFLSSRNNGDADVWFVWLKKSDWEKTQRDWEDMEEESEDKKDDKKEVSVQIDFEDIYKRLVQVTSLPGSESGLAFDKKGEFLYFTALSTSEKDGGRDLYKIKWDGSDLASVTSGDKSPYNVKLDPKGENIYALMSRGTLARFSTKSDKEERLGVSASMKIDYEAEREQKFEEGWRELNAGFYDPKFHGYDWDKLKKKYKPWTLAAATETDFRYMFNVMLGQLNASHMGMYGADRSETQFERTGLIGVELKNVRKGLEITHVVPGSPADRSSSKLNVGDVISAVNGSKISGDDNFYRHLANTVDEQLILEVEPPKGKSREVIIRPTRSLGTERYEEWVAERKRLTEEYSGGKLGYIHIQGMNWPSFERFERELTATGLGKEGIVIDVRFNGGGWTTDYLMAVLSVRQHAYTVPRGAAKNLDKENKKFADTYPYSERLPLSWWTKPSIAMCNEYSYSNAEIFSHAYKTLDIGTLVGQPTFGAVISTGGSRLIDGSLVRMPFRAWYVKATGENMEHGPAVPDILVDELPDGKGKGTDVQLKRAVEELLKQL